MKTVFFRTAASSIALLAASAAVADVTAEQVWEDWQANLELYGEDGVSIGSETIGDGRVDVTDLTLTLDDDVSVIVSALGDVSFVENGDGTVTVTMAESYPFTFSSADGTNSAVLTVTQDNMLIVVSGEPEAMNYAVSADGYEVRLTDLQSDEEITAEAFIRASDLSGSYQTDQSAGTNTTFDFATGSMDMLVELQGPDVESFVMSGQLSDIGTSGMIVLPEGADLDDPESFASEGIFRTETTAAQSTFVFDVTENGQPVSGGFTATAFEASADVNPDTLDYKIAFSDAQVSAESADMPVPFAMSLSAFENTMTIPVAASDEAAPFGYRLALMDFVINDEIWNMGDPGGQLPRDPATFIFDISGAVKLLFDIMDPDQEAAMALAGMPGELESLSINDITLNAVGVDVDGSGDFTFDNTDLETFDGFPRPQGELTVNVSGTNKLIDTLIGMGLLPEDQAMMGRMMMGMFTQPAGDDVLTSKIEVTEDGQVLANGQRIR